MVVIDSYIHFFVGEFSGIELLVTKYNKEKEVLLGIMTGNSKVLKDHAPFVGVSELVDSSANLAVRPHVKPMDYWDVYFARYEEGKIAPDKAGITIPSPQMDVNLDE